MEGFVNSPWNQFVVFLFGFFSFSFFFFFFLKEECNFPWNENKKVSGIFHPFFTTEWRKIGVLLYYKDASNGDKKKYFKWASIETIVLKTFGASYNFTNTWCLSWKSTRIRIIPWLILFPKIRNLSKKILECSTRCGITIFLSSFRFYVKSIKKIWEVLKLFICHLRASESW